MSLVPTSINKVSIPSHRPFTETLAETIIKNHQGNLPDLSKVVIFIPNAQAALQLRISLSLASNTTLVGGYIGNLRQWLSQQVTNSNTRQINYATKQLLLLEALQQHPDLFSKENHWQVCDSLLELFDELGLSHHQWLDDTVPAWIEKLQGAYKTHKNIAHLNQEAKIIHTLWHAWQQQLNEQNFDDEVSTLKQRLISPPPETLSGTHFYIVGLEQLSPLEKLWCENVSNIAEVTWLAQGDLPYENHEAGQSPDADLLNIIYSQDKSLFERTNNLSANIKPGFIDHISLLDTQNAEQEAQAVDLKIRQSLIAGHNNIAVVTENRKLARRLRALLDRAGINIQDTAGWSLATTSAASILERWLECIEQDFAHQPLLDLLKSPFFCSDEDRDEHLNLVYRFEQDIIQHENIANDINRYIKAINNRKTRLDLNFSNIADQLLTLLTKISDASNKLISLFSQASSQNALTWISAFISSIETLGILDQFSNDIAGIRIQQELEKLTESHNSASPNINWSDFRTWLASTLEREQFKPHDKISAVKIMNLQQAQYCHFDTLIIAGANQSSLPGSASQLPFFNQSVRQALQLSNWQQIKEYQLYQFKQLLLSSNDILITWQSEDNGEWLPVSPWVSSLKDFSQHAFKKDLLDNQLYQLISQLDPVTNQQHDLNELIEKTCQPKPVINNELIPDNYSASRHQRLIDCPYKFFAADALHLKPLEKITTELLKSEYGEKVHLILQAFHQQVRNLPPPFKDIIHKNNKSDALKHIKHLSSIVFESDIEDSIQHRGWLERWMETAEAYIDWQIKQQQEWHIYQLEQHAEFSLTPGIKLTGRLDRIDKNKEGLSIIDYKTGSTPKQTDINLAENIQLTSYATLLDNVCNVIYLKLDKADSKPAGTLDSDRLKQLKDDCLQRLQKVVESIHNNASLPAWGDTKTCDYCDMKGLCRKQTWEAGLL